MIAEKGWAAHCRQITGDPRVLQRLQAPRAVRGRERYVLQCIANVLQELQTHKIVHRDIKAANVLTVLYAVTGCPVLTDFGIARSTHEPKAHAQDSAASILLRRISGPHEQHNVCWP